MYKSNDPAEVAATILNRSISAVKVGACLVDGHALHSWGWNGMGPDGYGIHAEAHVIRRANPRRLEGSTLYVASVRARNNRFVISRPCLECQKLIRWAGIAKVWWRGMDGVWNLMSF